MNIELYYFSGTGNTLYIAKEIEKKMKNTTIIPIPKTMNKEVVEVEVDVLGILFPVYFMSLPEIVEAFIKKLTVKSNCYVFVICNSGASYGGALLKAQNLLSERGIQCQIAKNIYLPDNSIIFRVPDKEKQFSMFEIAKKEIEEIVHNVNEQVSEKAIKKGSVGLCVGENIMKPFCEKILGFKQMKVDKAKCNNCGLCVKSCPTQNIKIENNQLLFGNTCEMCFGCIHRCKQGAITFKRQAKKIDYQYNNPYIKANEMMI